MSAHCFMTLIMKRDTWLYRISLAWLASLAVGIPYALLAIH